MADEPKPKPSDASSHLIAQLSAPEKANRRRAFVQLGIQTGASNSQVVEVEPPDICPICRYGCTPHVLAPTAILTQRRAIEVCFRCPRHDCGSLFICYFSQLHPGNPQWVVARLAPATFAAVAFAEAVASVSPSFVEIYNQALRAESLDMDQLCGIGLRKALEFLIKDFAKRQHPTETEQIERLQLGPCITRYVADANVNACAKRAAWLGNDETHYVRRWHDKDIEDLKRLVRLTANWIDNTLLTQQYVSDMPEGGAP
ncbi:MAG: hypothetical protein QM756_10500 [Polyangiaceae bacterium]